MWLDEISGQQRALDAGEVVVADVQLIEGVDQHRDELGIAVTEVEHAAIEVQVQPAAAVDVVDPVPLAAAHHDAGAECSERADPVRADEPFGEGEDLVPAGGSGAWRGGGGTAHSRSIDLSTPPWPAAQTGQAQERPDHRFSVTSFADMTPWCPNFGFTHTR